MSDQPEPGTVPTDTDTAPAADNEQPAEQPDADSFPRDYVEKLRRELVGYRVERDGYRVERDGLATQLEAVRKNQIDTTVAAMGLKPQALWASGAQLPDLLDDNGVVDPDKVGQAVAKARTELGITGKRITTGRLKSGAMAPQEPRDGWREAFTPRRKREA